MTWYQEWFGQEYLELYAHRDEGEARRQVEFFRRRVGAIGGPVLDLACGSGRHLAELRANGYSAVGLDLSWVLLRTARERESGLRLARADMRRLPFCDGSVNGLVNFFTSFGYFDNEDDNAGVVREMTRVLSPGAPFLFDFMNAQRELRGLVKHETKELDGQRVTIQRWFEPESRTFNKRIAIEGRSFIERVRAYELDEIQRLFTESGLVVETVHGDFDGAPFHDDSPRLIIVGVCR